MTDKVPKLLFDALAAIGSAQEFMDACSLDQYAHDKMRRSAVERQLEVLGEACSRLARIEPALVDKVQNLKLAIDLRNRIIHGYDAVDDEIVYLTVTEDMDALKADLTQLLAFRGFGIEPLTPTHVALGS